MTTAMTILTGVLLLIGAGFGLVGALGLIRFPDVFTRMHAASKAGTLGSGFCLLAVAVNAASFDVTTRALAGVVFFILTAPVSAHLLARAAILAGYMPVGTDKESFPTGMDRELDTGRGREEQPFS